MVGPPAFEAGRISTLNSGDESTVVAAGGAHDGPGDFRRPRLALFASPAASDSGIGISPGASCGRTGAGGGGLACSGEDSAGIDGTAEGGFTDGNGVTRGAIGTELGGNVGNGDCGELVSGNCVFSADFAGPGGTGGTGVAGADDSGAVVTSAFATGTETGSGAVGAGRIGTAETTGTA